MKNLLSISIVLIISLIIFNSLGNAVLDNEDRAQEFALGIDNTAFFPNDNGLAYHCSDFEYFPIQNCIDSFEDHSSDNSLVIYTGNSQLHGINQPEKGLNSTSKILYESLQKNKNKAITVSIPNLNLQEQLILNIYLASKLPVTHLLLAASFDNTRETSIRESILPALKDQFVVKELDKLTFGKKILQTYGEKDNAGNDLSIEDDNLQQKVEKILDGMLTSIWPAWGMRERLRYRTIIEVYQFRNRVFSITPNSTRKKIPARYSDNMKSMRSLLEFASNKNLKVLIYSPPIRSDQKLPYDLNEFQQYKDDVRTMTNELGFEFADLQYVVPPEYWGYVDDTNSNTGNVEVDFMHFQGEGHAFLASEILQIFDNIKWLDKK